MSRITIAIITTMALILAACDDNGNGNDGTANDAGPNGDELVSFRVAVQVHTETNPPGERAEIWARGSGGWFFDTGEHGDLHESLGEFEPGRAGSFFVYPDGRHEGAEVAVPLELPDDFIAGSVRDMINVDIYDDEVVIWGSPIEGGEVSFAR